MSAPAIRVTNVSKAYRMWHSPAARLQSVGLHGVKRLVPPLSRRCAAAQAKLFRDFYALRDVGFELQRGETLGIIGRNGAGKSTLLQIIAGTLAPSMGTVEVNGKVAALLELGSGFNPDFTGRENVYLNGAILGLDENEMRERFAAIAAFADIGDFIDQPVKTYSSGMIVRLAFAVVAHVDADILIVDEALAVGDAFFVQKCMRWIREFKERGTLLFVAHNAAAVVSLCDRAIWLQDGAVALDGTAKRATEEYLAFFQNQEADPKAKGRGLPRAASIAPASPPSAPPPAPAAEKPPSFSFDPARSYGEGNARIVAVELVSADDPERRLPAVAGGEHVTLRIVATALAEIRQPILGFYLKDHLGQYLFGENTYLSNLGRELVLSPQSHVTAEFSFQMPLLSRGQYMFAAALATGTQEAHVQQHWIYDALPLESTNQDSYRGLVGIPMEGIGTSLAARADGQPALHFSHE